MDCLIFRQSHTLQKKVFLLRWAGIFISHTFHHSVVMIYNGILKKFKRQFWHLLHPDDEAEVETRLLEGRTGQAAEVKAHFRCTIQKPYITYMYARKSLISADSLLHYLSHNGSVLKFTLSLNVG